MNLEIKPAKKEDASLVLAFIKAIAKYEKLTDKVEAKVEDIEKSIFDNQEAYIVIAYLDNLPVGFALYFYNYSTFKGRKGLYLEDLFVYKKYRGKGIGNKLFEYLKALAKAKNCGRMEWVCLDWNKSAIEFYKKKQAISLDDWITFRLDETKL
ncbi:MAG: N-acetyltransferase family protein [Bacillota bacterium]